MPAHADRAHEVDTKLAEVRELLAGRGLDAVVLGAAPNAAWITAGAAVCVDESTGSAAFTIVVTEDRAYILTDYVEAPRLRLEEDLGRLGFELVVEPWYARGSFLASQLAGKRLACDDCRLGIDGEDIGADLRHLRSHLRSEEVARYRDVCARAADAMREAIEGVRPGMTEHEAAGLLAGAARARGGGAIVCLAGSDERVYGFRHPLPTAKEIERYAMLVLGFRSEGLVAALTRLVHFGPLPDELRAKMEAVARVDARLISGTQPGRALGAMFDLARQAYADEGYPEAINEHHQGGVIAYQGREALATPHDATPLAVHQAFAWNPSIRGVKSEDTILLGASGPEVLTAIPGWPMLPVALNGHSLARPAIREK